MVREARDGFEALSLMRERMPALVFLDVDMPELSGLDVLRQVPSPRPKVVFVTAYAHFAVAAFDENACDYLVKPFTPERFARAVERALAQLDADQKLRALESTLARSGRYLDRLALRLGARVDLVAVDDVMCLQSQGHHTYLHARGREYVTELTLVHLEERLDPNRFVRVHRNALVNWDHVTRIIDGQERSVELRSGLRVGVSRRHARSVLDRSRADGK